MNTPPSPEEKSECELNYLTQIYPSDGAYIYQTSKKCPRYLNNKARHCHQNISTILLFATTLLLRKQQDLGLKCSAWKRLWS